MIRAMVFEAISGDDREFIADIAEPESCRIENVRSEIVENTGTLIPPIRIAHQPCRAVAIEHPAAIDRAQRTGRDELAHPHEMWLKTMIISGVEDDSLLPFPLFQIAQSRIVFRDQWLLNQRMLAVV